MTTQNINISAKNVAGKCDLKCSYHFKYSESNSTAKNNGISINLSYDSTSMPPVLYNQQKYTVAGLSIISPSAHLFNGSTMPGEMIIEHVPVKGGNTLYVCIPFISSSETSTASQIITEIINTVASNAPSDGDSTNLNISNFNLQNIVPRKPFFSYNQGSSDWIVYGQLEAIPLSSSTISTLQKIITPNAMKLTGGPVFYNAKGPISGTKIGDGLYISCQPTGSSSEQVPVTYNKNPVSSIDLSKLFNNPLFKTILMIIIGCLGFIVLFYIINLFFKYLSSDSLSLKLPSIPIPKFS
jgi:carbonic anhydrase